MDRLPPEILHLILQALSEIEETGYDSAVSIMEIKALRLSCRTFADLAPQYLFHDVWLYMEEGSFGKLKALTDHPSYGRMVRVLKIFPKLLSADLLVKEDYESCVKDITFTGDHREQWGFDTDGRRDLSQVQLDAGFTEYTQIYEQQIQTRTSADKLLHHALAAFTRLRSIMTGFVDEIIEDDVCFDRCSKIQDIARKTLMAHSCDGWKSGLHDSEDAIMILTAIASSQRKWLTLDLTNTCGSFDPALIDTPPSTLEKVKEALVSLSQLALSLEAMSELLLHQTIERDFSATYLKYAANVEYIYVSTGSGVPIIFFHTVFRMTHWPRLRNLRLHGFMVNADDLNGFIDRHSATLEEIDLHTMILTSGCWKKVFARMQGKQALQRFWFDILFVGDVDSEQKLLAIEWDAANDDLLLAFVFGGKEWSSKLPAAYSQEAKWYGTESI